MVALLNGFSPPLQAMLVRIVLVLVIDPQDFSKRSRWLTSYKLVLPERPALDH
jgi:hypothetical protein